MCLSYRKVAYTVRQVPLLHTMHSPLDVLVALEHVGDTGGVLVVVRVPIPLVVRRFQVHRLHFRGHHSLHLLGCLLLVPLSSSQA